LALKWSFFFVIAQERADNPCTYREQSRSTATAPLLNCQAWRWFAQVMENPQSFSTFISFTSFPSISSQNAQRCQHWLAAPHLFYSPRIHALPPTHRTWAESPFESRVPVLCPGEAAVSPMNGVFSNWLPLPGTNWPWRGQPHRGAAAFAKVSGAESQKHRELQGNRSNTVGIHIYKKI